LKRCSYVAKYEKCRGSNKETITEAEQMTRHGKTRSQSCYTTLCVVFLCRNIFDFNVPCRFTDIKSEGMNLGCIAAQSGTNSETFRRNVLLRLSGSKQETDKKQVSLRNVGERLPDYRASNSTKKYSSWSPLSETQIQLG
jgi:hypothetical protein